jgi:hypothetical protein
MTDTFYQRISTLLDISRDNAKVAYYKWAYGRAQNKSPISALMSENYEQANEYAMRQKQVNYRSLSWYLQRLEASIFIDDIFLRWMNIPKLALTVHDCIGVPYSDADKASVLIMNAMHSRGLRVKIRQD